jgi:hypothetical protein
MSDPTWNEYGEHRTGIEVDRLLHYGHIIPVSHGYTTEYVAEHFPGWTWNQLMAIWRAAGVVVRSGVGGPPSCDRRVKAIHFDGPDSFAIEWLDGTVTVRCVPMYP